MRFRPSSFLASAAVLFLWGCPVGNAPSTGDGTDSPTGGASANFGNTEAHTDAVDSQSDTAWVGQVQVPPGSAAVRVLMTDAPMDADNVFVTFCGVRVATHGSKDSVQAGEAEHANATVDAGVVHGDIDVEGAASAPPTGGAGEHGDSSDAGPSTQSQDPAGEDDGADAEIHSGSDAGPSAANGGAGGWISISDQCQTLDLLTLQNGITEDIGINALPAGSYGQIRLMLTDASIVKSGVKQALTVPSGTESGIKIIGGFTIVEGQPTTVTIDFDAASSIHYAGGQGFIMNPVIKIVDVTRHGDGSGSGDSASGAGGGSSGAPPSTTDGEHGQGTAGSAAAGHDAPAGSGGSSGAAAGDHGAGAAAGSSGEAGESGDPGRAGAAGGSAQY